MLLPEERGRGRGVFARLVAGDFPNTHRNRWVASDGRRPARRVGPTPPSCGERRRGRARRRHRHRRHRRSAGAEERAAAPGDPARGARRGLARLRSSALDYSTTLDTVARRLSELIGDGALIRVVSPDGAWLVPVAVYHPDPERGGAAPAR